VRFGVNFRSLALTGFYLSYPAKTSCHTSRLASNLASALPVSFLPIEVPPTVGVLRAQGWCILPYEELCGVEKELHFHSVEWENHSTILATVEHAGVQQRCYVCVYGLHIATHTARCFTNR
jgi:hypothetical protein